MRAFLSSLIAFLNTFPWLELALIGSFLVLVAAAFHAVQLVSLILIIMEPRS